MKPRFLTNVTRVLLPILLFSWARFPQYAAAQQKQAFDREVIVQQLNTIAGQLEAAATKITRESFDPQAIVDQVGKDPVALFEWVRDNTYLVPYRGSLRGPVGVLMDRMGNSLDRALLLSELLRIAGHDSRIVRGKLSATEAASVLQESLRMRQSRTSAQSSAPSSVNLKPAEEFAPVLAVSNQHYERAVSAFILQKQQIMEEAVRRTHEHSSQLRQIIDPPGPDSQSSQYSRLVDDLRHHWWIQLRAKSDWIDFDPTTEHSVGITSGSAAAYYPPQQLPEDALHRVVIRLVIERWENEELTEHKVFEHTVHAHKTIGKTFILRHVPVNWAFDTAGATKERQIAKARHALASHQEWLPVLLIGAERVAQSSFDTFGGIHDDSSGGRGLDNTVREVFGVFGGSPTDTPADGGTLSSSHLTGEWLELVVQKPGEDERVVRRQIFDLIGPTARATHRLQSEITVDSKQSLDRGIALLSERELLVQVCRLEPALITNLVLEKLRSNLSTLTPLLLAGSISETNELIDGLSLLPGPVVGMAYFRTEWSMHRDYTYFASPNILSYVRGFLLQPTGDIVPYAAYDIIDNRIGVVAGLELDPFVVRLEQGIFDTNVEFELMGGTQARVRSVPAYFSKSKSRGMDWVVLRTPGEVDAIFFFPPDIAARLGSDLTNGYSVIVPPTAIDYDGEPSLGWWRIDPTTGDTLGMAHHGGSAMTMWQSLVIWGITAAGCVISATLAGEPDPVAVTYLCLGGPTVIVMAPVLGIIMTHGAFVATLVGSIATVLGGLGSHLFPYDPINEEMWNRFWRGGFDAVFSWDFHSFWFGD